jgi:predicted DNA-binding transcriptional regulator YafY
MKNMTGRNSQVARIYCLLNILENSRDSHTVKELHERVTELGHEVGKRTIYRDLEALSQAGFPLFPEGDGEAQQWKLERNTNINQYFVLTARELFALYLARGMLTPLSSTPFYADLNSIFNKLESRLGGKQAEHLAALENEFKFEPGPQWGLGLNPEILETVRAACAENQVLKCAYYSANSKKESVRELGPHFLYYAKGGLYLVAEDLGDQKMKVFALPRFKTAEMLDQPYERRVKTPEEMFDGSMGIYTAGQIHEVVMEFEAEVAEYVRERRWHPSQRVVSLEGGKIRLHLDVADTPELHSWILGFGPGARILSPVALAEKVAVRAMETAALYSKKAG